MQRCTNMHKQVHMHAIIYSHVSPNRSGFTVWHRWGWLNVIRPSFFPMVHLFVFFLFYFYFFKIPKSSCLTNERLQRMGHMVPRGYEDSLTLKVSVELIIAICERAGVVWCTPFSYPRRHKNLQQMDTPQLYQIEDKYTHKLTVQRNKSK